MTTSLEISKKLWERGVRVPSYWNWRWNEYEPPDKKARLHHWQGESIALDEGSRCISAPMLHELLEIMPGDWSLYNNPDGTYGIDWFTEDEFIKYFDFDKNICDCVAKCLMYLIDNGYCKVVDGKITTGDQDD